VKFAWYREPVVDHPFQLPLLVDLGAVILLAATGAIEGVRKRYDLFGVAVMALVTGLGGGLLRDGIFLQGGPPAALQDGRYLAAVLGGMALGVVFARGFHRLKLVVASSTRSASASTPSTGPRRRCWPGCRSCRPSWSAPSTPSAAG
jgi:hypothetical protein